MNKQIIGKFIISIFLIGRFLIIPICTSIYELIKLITMKNVIKKAGINYCIKEKNIKNPVFFLITSILMIILSIFLFILGENGIILTLFLSFSIIFISYYLMFKLFGNICGIYEYGIINGNRELVDWSKIHSYNIKNKDIIGYFNDGSLFEYKNVENIKEINILFEKNNIKKREDY
jgi:hypothetical protein